MRTLIFILCLQSLTCWAQREKELQIRGAVGIGGYGVLADYKFKMDNETYDYQDTSGAATNQLIWSVMYEPHHRVNVGLDLRMGQFLYDPAEDNRGKKNSFRTYGLRVEGNIVSRPEFRWYLGAGFHLSKLEMTDPLDYSTSDTAGESLWKGGGSSLYTGIVAYIAHSPLAFNLDFVIDRNKFQLKEFVVGGDNQNIDDWKVQLNTVGVLMNVGLAWRFQMK
jgi:hypothetical protein